MSNPVLSIVIPVYRETLAIRPCLEYLSGCKNINMCEIIVVDGDGGSTGTPRDVLPLRVIESDPGRGVQLGAGRRAATSEKLLFLHVDTIPPSGFVQLVSAALDRHPAGAFDLHVVTQNPVTALISLVGRMRSRVTRIPYGDQVQFIRTAVFDEIGGYPGEPLMEDVALMDKLKAAGHKITFLTPPARTSDRRWRAEGAIRGTFRNWRLMLAYRAGVPPSQLMKRYKPRPSAPDVVQHRRHSGRVPDSARVIVFYRAIRPGEVKTRLARDLGDDVAAAIYEAMLADLISNLSALRSHIVPFIDVVDAGQDIFGNGQPQSGSCLEERMDNAFVEVFAAGAESAVLVGSDIPGLDAVQIRAALDALRHHDAVVGPSVNGGYYLIGYRRNTFQPILAETRDKTAGESTEDPFISLVSVLDAHGLSWRRLPPLRDVDTVQDLEQAWKDHSTSRGHLHDAIQRHVPRLSGGH